MTQKHEITNLFENWNQALQTGDPENVANLYLKDAILLPTVSNQVRHNHSEIIDYFVHFLKKKPFGTINESNIRIFNDIAINSGVYTFTLNKDLSVKARFTFVYKKIEEIWKILEHHSSKMPE